eukprot:13161061-Heterocapsa_arctica.AAC.1
MRDLASDQASMNRPVWTCPTMPSSPAQPRARYSEVAPRPRSVMCTSEASDVSMLNKLSWERP